MAHVGMDVDQVAAAGKALKDRAAEIDSLVAKLDGIVRTMPGVWDGPDSQQFVNEWWPEHKRTLVAASSHVAGLGQSALNNASEQREASGVGGGGVSGHLNLDGMTLPSRIAPSHGWWPEGATEQDVFAETRRIVATKMPNSPWSYGDVGQFVPGVSTALEIRGYADKISQGEVPIHEMVDTAAGELRAGAVKTGNLPGYLGGVALGTWNTTIEVARETDWSLETFDSTSTYARDNPADAVDAAVDAVVAFVPNILKNFKFW